MRVAEDARGVARAAEGGGRVIEAIVVFAVARRRLVLALTLIAALLAAFVCTRLRFDALPDVTTNQVLVLTRAPGLTPEEVERLVTRPIELGLGGIPGWSSSAASRGMGSRRSRRVHRLGGSVARAADGAGAAGVGEGSLPEGVEAPELGPLTGGLGEIFHFTVRSPVRTPAELLELVELRVVPLLRSVSGVVEVNTWGGERRTLDVVGQPEAMARWRVSLTELEAAVVAATGTAAGSSLADGAGAGAAARGGAADDAVGAGRGDGAAGARAGRRRCGCRTWPSCAGARRRGSARRRRRGGRDGVRDGADAARGQRAAGDAAGARADGGRDARRCRRTCRSTWCTTDRSWSTRRCGRWRRT
jgi:hypothetical protein